MGGLAPLTFTGISSFSNDYQTILNRAVQIAQIPVQALQNQDSNVLQQETLLGNLNSAVANLSSSLSALGTLASGGSLGATSSDPTVVTAQATGAATPASYTINSISSAASAASERSTASFADSSSTPVSTNGTMKLVVGSQSYTFTLSSANNNLTGLVSEINSLNAGVTAQVLTASPTSNYLSITANSTGATTLQLLDNPSRANTNILTNSNQGSNAVFQLNGINISQAGNVVNSVIPGLTFTILGASANPVTLTLASDPSQLSTALQSFVADYNAVATQLNAQTGQGAGLLLGDSVISQLNTALGQLTSYHINSGNVQSLVDLGITFNDNTGQLSFSQSAFDALSSANIAGALTFLGSSASGFGGFSQSINEFSDPVSGTIQDGENGLRQTDQNLQQQISTLNDQISVMQQSLQAQLQQADAAVAQLENQQTVLNALLQAQNAALYGYNANGSRGFGGAGSQTFGTNQPAA